MLTPFRFDFFAMGSPCELLIFAKDNLDAQQAAQAAILEVQRIEKKYSRYQAESILSQINASAGKNEWVPCDEETLWLLNFANTLFENSQGLFDITSGVLRRVWNFQQPSLPSQTAIDKLLPLIDWSSVKIEAGKIQLPLPEMEIDFGGFGKEYAADSAAKKLMDHKIAHGYVNLGGDIRALGPQPDGEPWQIAIQDPRNPQGIVATLPLYQGGLATSGDYEKFFELDGKRYCHILNPRTGWPVSYWQSISIAAPLAIAAGSCSTIAMLLESEGLAWVKNTGFSYLGITHTGTEVFG